MTGERIAVDRFASGTRLGDYQIDGDLPGGWNVEAYAATHILLPRRARLLVLHPAFVDQQAASVQLLREACLLEAMHHPGVPRVFNTGVVAGRPWIAYELIEGVPLADTLAAGPLPVPEVLALLRDAAEVLEHAHRRNVVHRNLRPEVLLRVHGRTHPICIIGWGDARLDDGAEIVDASLTSGEARSKREAFAKVDHRADVLALGAVAFTALTGARRSVLTACERSPGAPRALTMLIDRMLAAEPEARPSCAEVRAAAIRIAELSEVAPPDDDEELLIEEVAVELVDISRSPPPIPPQRKPKWTPALGASATPRATSADGGSPGSRPSRPDF